MQYRRGLILISVCILPCTWLYRNKCLQNIQFKSEHVKYIDETDVQICTGNKRVHIDNQTVLSIATDTLKQVPKHC